MIEMGLGVSAGLAVLAAALMCAVFAGGAGAATGSRATAARDAASTRAFINGELAVMRAELGHESAELAAGKAYVAAVHAECGDVQVNVPRQLSLHQVGGFLNLTFEMAFAYSDRALAPARREIDRIARRQARVRFSDPALQWSVRGSTSALAALLALRSPDLCADVRKASAKGLTAMTPAGHHFVADATTVAAGVGSPAGLIRKMRPYAPNAVGAGLKRLAALQHRLQRADPDRWLGHLFHSVFGKSAAAVGGGAQAIGTKL
jgi:hypothetical protein